MSLSVFTGPVHKAAQALFISQPHLGKIIHDLENEMGYLLLNRSLAVGDKVLLLRVQSGQKYIVLSRLF